MIDVGQGDSVLVEQKDGKNILIDTGGKQNYINKEFPNKKGKSLTDSVLIPYLKARGIRKIDVLIVTHGDYDHALESLSLIDSFPTDLVLFNNGNDNLLEQKLQKKLQIKKIKYKKISQTSLQIGHVKWNFLNSKSIKSENKDSLIAYTKINHYNILFMGDAEKENETTLQNVYNLPKMDILKVGHHGSKTSSSVSFIETIKPKYAMISAGVNNLYGHPHIDTLRILKKVGAKTYLTSEMGMIRVQLRKKIKIEICGR